MLTAIEPAQFIPDSVAVTLENVEPRDGNMPPEDLALICRMVAHLRPRTLFEFGTFLGATTYNMARYAPPDAVVYTLDLPPATRQTALPLDAREWLYVEKPEVGTVYRKTREAGKIIQVFGDSALTDFSRFAGLMDFILIDASHAYENCLSDSLRALTMRSPRGVIAWHDDSLWTGVTAALDDLQRSSERFAALRHVRGTRVAVLLQ